MLALPSDASGFLGLKNVILPGENVDDALRRYILATCSKSLRDTAGHRNWLLEATKRYEAMRSTRSLDHDDPGVPWKWASNVGIPAELIAGESLLPRFNAATTDSDPIYRVEVLGDDQDLKDHEEPLTRFYQDVNTRKVFLRRVRKETYMNLMIDGDGIEGPEWEEKWVQQASTAAVFMSADGQIHRDEDGQIMLFSANLPEPAYPTDPMTDKKLRKVLVQRKGQRKVFEGYKIRSWRISECMWPSDAATPDVNELDWFGLQMWKSHSWFKTREGDPLQGNMKNIKELLARHRDGIPEAFDTPDEQSLTRDLRFPRSNKILVWLWFGRFDVDGDGIDEEIVAWVAPAQRLILGWRLTPFSKRPFFHYQLFQMPGRFTAKGIPHVVKGLRDTIDFLANSINNRVNMYGDPPIMYETDSGFDPDTMEFGTGALWGPLASGGLAKVRALELPQSQENIAKMLIEFYLSLIQRITSITDFSLGGPSDTTAPNVKTATGTQAVLAEGSMKFSDFVREYQQTSEEEMEFIDQELMPLAKDDETIRALSPMPMTKEILGLPKRFRATGSSITMNPQTVQNIAVLMFDKLVNDPIIALDPKLVLYLRKQLFSAFDQDVVLPKPEVVEKGQIDQMKKMFMSLSPEEKAAVVQQISQAMPEGGGAPVGGGAPSGVAKKPVMNGNGSSNGLSAAA